MTHYMSRNPFLSTAVTASALAAATMLTAGCGPASSSAAPGAAGSSAASAPGRSTAVATPSASAPASGAPASPSATASAASGGSASGTPGTARSNCTTQSLKATTGSIQGTAGSFYLPIVFTNTGGSTCSLRGFPGVSLANSGGVIGNPATRDSSQSSTTVTLAPGAKASALLRIGDASAYGSTCKADTSSFLLVYPPNETAAIDIPYKGTGCRNKSIGLLQVRPVVSGSSGV